MCVDELFLWIIEHYPTHLKKIKQISSTRTELLHVSMTRGITTKFALDDFLLTEKPKQFLQEWNPKEKTLLLYGKAGSGKTSFAKAIMKSMFMEKQALMISTLEGLDPISIVITLFSFLLQSKSIFPKF